MVPERWALVGKGRDPETNLPMAWVAREKRDPTIRLTIWKLVYRRGIWYSRGMWISKGIYRKFPEPNGVRLSDSITDQTLKRYADETLS